MWRYRIVFIPHTSVSISWLGRLLSARRGAAVARGHSERRAVGHRTQQQPGAQTVPGKLQNNNFVPKLFQVSYRITTFCPNCSR